MTGIVSQQMKDALELIKKGETPYAAAKATGISRSTISRSKLYQDWLAEQKLDNQKRVAEKNK